MLAQLLFLVVVSVVPFRYYYGKADFFLRKINRKNYKLFVTLLNLTSGYILYESNIDIQMIGMVNQKTFQNFLLTIVPYYIWTTTARGIKLQLDSNRHYACQA